MRGDAWWQRALGGVWRLCGAEPSVNGMPHYVHEVRSPFGLPLTSA